MKTFDIMALDSNFQIASLLSYTNLQWTRKFYEPGTFSIEIPFEQYAPTFKYIYTKARRELGVISQVNYMDKIKSKSVHISGYFLENELNKRIEYQKATTTNITNQPTWVNQIGNAEDVAYAFFNGFKDVQAGSTSALLGINAATSKGRGNHSEHERTNQLLGNKIYTILKPSEMSYKVDYDFLTSSKIFSVYKGVDRTQDNEELNNPIVFSTRYGNIKEADVLLDRTNYKNGCMVVNSYTENDVEKTIVEATINPSNDNAFVVLQSHLNNKDYGSANEFIAAILAEGKEELTNHLKTINLQFDTLQGSYEYLEDFDLGDKCSIEIAELQLSADAVLIGCYEVIKKGVWTLTMEFGTPEILNGGF